MLIQIELWQLISLGVSLGISVVAFAAGFGKILLDQGEKRQNERFAAHSAALDLGIKTVHDTLTRHIEAERITADQIQALERDFLQWRAELPVQYVRREDYIRNQTVIEAKLDALAIKIENLQLRSQQNA